MAMDDWECTACKLLLATSRKGVSLHLHAGEGLLPASAQAAGKIACWKIVDTAEFLQEFWTPLTEKDLTSFPIHRTNPHRQI